MNIISKPFFVALFCCTVQGAVYSPGCDADGHDSDTDIMTRSVSPPTVNTEESLPPGFEPSSTLTGSDTDVGARLSPKVASEEIPSRLEQGLEACRTKDLNAIKLLLEPIQNDPFASPKDRTMAAHALRAMNVWHGYFSSASTSHQVWSENERKLSDDELRESREKVMRALSRE